MNKSYLLACVVFTLFSSNVAVAKPGFSVDSLVTWETAVGIPRDKQAEAHVYVAAVIRTSNQFFGWSSQRAYEFGGIGVIERDIRGFAPEHKELAFETPIVGVSENFEIVSSEYISLEVGIGGYFKKPTSAVGSAFTFGERLALKSSIENFDIEVFYRHFSNGSFTSDNSGYDFFGLSFTSRFQ